jgi:hypothetical protein
MKKCKTIGLVLASALLTTSAFSQITISGTNETSYYFGGDTKQRSATSGNPISTTRGMGNETTIRLSGTAKLPNGQIVTMYGIVDSDSAADISAISERGFDIGIANGISFVYGYDRAFGSELVRSITPLATTRPTDTGGAAGAVADLVDVTSNEHAIGFTATDLVGKGSTISVAYNPNLSGTSISSSDTILQSTNNANGYGIGARLTPVAGLTVAAGYTKIDHSLAATSKDVTSKVYGIAYAQAPFAIGIQRTDTEGELVAVTTVSKDQTDLISATYAVNKEITLGYSYAEMERTRSGTKSTVDGEVQTFSVAYNLGPVVLSYDHQKSENAPTSVSTDLVAGNDVTINKVKVRVAF